MQQIGQSFILALKSLRKSKMRAFLTMLGIIIGISAVIIITSLGNGMQKYMNDSFVSMGTNLITVTVNTRGTRSVDEDFMQEIVDKYPDLLEHMSPTVQFSGEVKNGSETTDNTTSIEGVNESYYDMKGFEMLSGRFLSYLDIEDRHKVCVIGTYVADTLFGSRDVIGQTIKISGNSFKIIGLLDEQADSSESTSDDAVYIPYTTAAKLSRMGRIAAYYFAITDENKAVKAKAAIENSLYRVFGSDDYYEVISLSELLDELNSMMDVMITVLSAIAAISLAVGGVGIMNIMLVSVSERTREIGIRKSLGAKRRNILSQFVIEAMTLSLVGGFIGMVLGILISYPIGTLLELTAVPKPSTIALAISVSVGIGVIFGYLPASKASKLNPIDALHYE